MRIVAPPTAAGSQQRGFFFHYLNSMAATRGHKTHTRAALVEDFNNALRWHIKSAHKGFKLP